MKKKFSIELKGKEHLWAIHIEIDPRDVADMIADDVNIEVLHNIVSSNINHKHIYTYSILQDLFNFKFKDAYDTFKSMQGKKDD
jgi:hypothetical protein